MLGAVAATVIAFATSGAAAAETDLRIRLWPEGRGEGAARTWTLECGPRGGARGGTHPRRATACRRLYGLTAPFTPVREDTQCAQIYGGPAETLVTGTYRGSRLWVRLRRSDGCQIARWRRISFLTP